MAGVSHHLTLGSPLNCKEIKPIDPKGYQSWIFNERFGAEAEAPIFGHLMRRTDSFEKTLMLRKTEGRRTRDNRGLARWMASLMQWTWVWVGSGGWRWTGRPGVLQSMGPQSRTRLSDWTELNWVIKAMTQCLKTVLYGTWTGRTNHLFYRIW